MKVVEKKLRVYDGHYFLNTNHGSLRIYCRGLCDLEILAACSGKKVLSLGVSNQALGQRKKVLDGLTTVFKKIEEAHALRVLGQPFLYGSFYTL